MEIKGYTLRISEEILEKFDYVSQYHGRSINKQIIQLMKKQVNEFEEKHGRINIEEIGVNIDGKF